MTFRFAPYVPAERVESTRLGASTSTKLVDADVGKPVKLGADTFVVCGVDENIDAFVNSVEPYTVDGYSYGGVVRSGRFYAQVVAAGTTVAVGDCVIAAAQAALGTSQANPIIKKQATPVAGVDYFKVISLLGDTGAAGKVVLIERL